MPTAQKPLILLIDKDNFLASLLAEKLDKDTTVVIVSEKQVAAESDVVQVPYISPIPKIPDGSYASLVLVWSNKKAHLLDPLQQKAEKEGIGLFIVVRHEEQGGLPENIRATVLILGDLFEGRGLFPLSRLLSQTKAKKRMHLSNMGLIEWHPVLFDDVIDTLVQEILHKAQENKTYFLGPRHAYTTITIAHALQKIDPDILVDFSGEKENAQQQNVHQSLFASYDSIVKLQEVYKHIVAKNEKHTREVASVVFSKPKKKSTKGKWVWYVVFLVIFFLALPFLVAISSGGIGGFLLASAVGDAKSGNFSNALSTVNASQENFSLSLASLNIVVDEASLINQQQLFAPIQKEVTTGQALAKIASSGIEFSESLAKILLGKSVAPSTDAQQAVASLQQEEVLLQQVNPQDMPSQYQKLLISIQQINTMLSGTTQLLPQILGIGSERTYLILFQNNMELRPGGGFIGSYGLLQLKNGAVQNFSIHDVYDADGQLQGHVEPPFAIRRYVPIVHLYLRDSNFDPDFTNDGKIAANLFLEESGQKVDGVIGIDLDVLKSLLASVGSVYVPSYNQTVTDNNFFTLLEEHAEKNFFPGSTQKKDFLQAFGQALFAAVQSKKTFDASKFVSQIPGLLTGKHFLVSFADSQIQSLFTLSGLSDSLQDNRASTSGTLNDVAGVVEANLGVNKVNAFVSRSMMQQVSIDNKGNVNGTLTLSLKNSSDGSWPGGAYKNYVRFVLPENAVLTGVFINNVEQHMIPAITSPSTYEAKGFVAPQGLEVVKEVEEGKILYGFLVSVPVESTLPIQVSYTIPQAFALSEQKQTYNLLLWKQPGIEDSPYELDVTLPNGYGFLQSSTHFTTSGQTATVKTTIAGDTNFSISFGAR